MTRSELVKFANETAENYSSWHWKKLYKCSAEYLELDNCVILRSYWTIVAIYKPSTSTVFEFDYYSTTTSQHVRKFAKILGASRLTKLHKDSTRIIEQGFSKYVNTYKLNADEWKRVIDSDFVTYIPSNWT